MKNPFEIVPLLLAAALGALALTLVDHEHSVTRRVITGAGVGVVVQVGVRLAGVS